ncbi:cytochrome P450 monooxygenase [Laetiporus sulphureus 93-53]|uniref:Cytochrome P450 monooxygenase n=1 Tax=Laetiporus sulphureus 93-53 TaxID=1314785 RepID=A0A165HJA9_9APHY|nr:cytochrome P450 monooxygenase [Laetiporus sulphureus 93-53]KZT11800.1 cytochrome P450 monooxygenase [Laetiporus sulphureus 93-53]
MQSLGIITCFFIALLSIVLIRILCSWILTEKRGLPLPPGPKPFPLIGNAHQVPLQSQPEVFTQWALPYGDIVFARLFSTPAIILNTAQVARDLMEKRGSKYSGRPRFLWAIEMVGFDPVLAFMPYGNQWAQQRKWFKAALQGKEALTSYYPVQRTERRRFLLAMVQTPYEWEFHIKRYAAALMLEITYGHSITDADDDYIHLVDDALKQFTEAAGGAAALVDFFPSLRYLPTWMPGAGFKRKARELRAIIRKMLDVPVERVKHAMALGDTKPSFTASLLAQLHGESAMSSEAHIRGAAAAAYAGGADTTIIVLMAFILAMVLHPEVCHKAQAEIDRVIGRGRLPDFADRTSLPYLDCVLKEVYRWSCPVHLGLPHAATEDDEYRGYFIPKGSMVISNIWRVLAMTRNPELYPDADAFRPERFEVADPEIVEAMDPSNLIFGFGRRKCPGAQLGDADIWIAVAGILAAFDIRKAVNAANAEIIPAACFSAGLMRHVKSFPCEVVPRKGLNLETIE